MSTQTPSRRAVLLPSGTRKKSKKATAVKLRLDVVANTQEVEASETNGTLLNTLSPKNAISRKSQNSYSTELL